MESTPNGAMAAEALDTQRTVIKFTCRSPCTITRVSITGNCPELGSWDMAQAIHLRCMENADSQQGTNLWESDEIAINTDRLPLRFRVIGNAHRSKPTSRPLIWDQVSRCFTTLPDNGFIHCEFDPTPDNSDSGWVHPAGAGTFQLRVGQPPGSTEPLVNLSEGLQEAYRVELYEAKSSTSEEPKQFARISFNEGLGLLRSAEDNEVRDHADAVNNVVFLLNSQSLEALAFRVDVKSLATGKLIARCFVSPQTLASLEGTINASLMTSNLEHAGTFHAAFLVVTSLQHPNNNLGNLQRKRWVASETLDIGHRGSGASAAKGSHSVRENTLLSFQKAALNHSDFIEFDVHQTADGEIVVHHDFEVRLALGTQEVKIPLILFTFNQLQSQDFTRLMVHSSDKPHHNHGNGGIDGQKNKLQYTLKRTMTSGEDMFRSIFKPTLSTSPEAPPINPGKFLSDRLTSLREAFRRTPAWLGFNIELKYPTAIEVAAMGARFYSRSQFVDAVLKVVLEEARGRKVIFSTFDPDCATLVSLKQPRYPVFYLTCAGRKQFDDPRMNSLEAALQFASSSHLQGVVAEASGIMSRLKDVVAEFHSQGLYLFTWGEVNNDITCYKDQKAAGVDAIILDDVAKMAKAIGKQQPTLFPKAVIRSPASIDDLHNTESDGSAKIERLSFSESFSMLALAAIEPPNQPPPTSPKAVHAE